MSAAERPAENDAPGMRPTVDTGDVLVCAGCGKQTAADERAGWRCTDAPWCPSCAWLA